MMEIQKYRLAYVKEDSLPYDFDTKIISMPEMIAQSVNQLFHLDTAAEEHFILFCFDTGLKIIGAFEVAHGTLNASLVNTREVLKRALLCNAYSIAVVHNHFSDTTPSREDLLVTSRLQKACNIFELQFLDHIIINRNDWYSFKEGGDI